MESKWKSYQVSSSNKESIVQLSDNNHIMHFQDRIFEIYNIDKEQERSEKSKGLDITITGWTDDRMSKDENGNYLDIIVHTDSSLTIWEPYVEYLIKKDFFKERKINSVEFGYIDGRSSHFDPVGMKGGYILWIELNCK